MGAPQLRYPEMLVETYEKSKHFDLMNSWYRGWNYQPIPEEYMPKIGYVVGGCVMQFLALTDCNVAWLEGFISDPASDPETRRRAIEIAQELVLTHARTLGLTRLFTFVRRQHVLETALQACKDNGVKAFSTPGFLIEGAL
jgi:hypothetical protein